MTTNLAGRTRVLQKQDRFAASDPYIILRELVSEKIILHSGTTGYSPLMLSIKRTGRGANDISRIAIETAKVPSFTYLGATFNTFEVDGIGGVLYAGIPVGITDVGYSQGLTTAFWVPTGITVAGYGVTSNKAAFGSKLVDAKFSVVSTTGFLKDQLFRIRRAYDTVVAGAVLGVGNGINASFVFTIANTPICPGSVAISFTDAVGLKTDLIRDNGRGRLATAGLDSKSATGHDILLSVIKPSTIDYLTGALVLEFSASHIPTATNITIDYEHDSSDSVSDIEEYMVDWRMEY